MKKGQYRSRGVGGTIYWVEDRFKDVLYNRANILINMSFPPNLMCVLKVERELPISPSPPLDQIMGKSQ